MRDSRTGGLRTVEGRGERNKDGGRKMEGKVGGKWEEEGRRKGGSRREVRKGPRRPRRGRGIAESRRVSIILTSPYTLRRRVERPCVAPTPVPKLWPRGHTRTPIILGIVRGWTGSAPRPPTPAEPHACPGSPVGDAGRGGGRGAEQVRRRPAA